MGDTSEGFFDLKLARQAERRERLRRADVDFPSAHAEAKEAGLILTRLGEFHFRLMADKWSVDLWPSTQRIIQQSGGLLPRQVRDLKWEDWTLIDVVKKAKESLK